MEEVFSYVLEGLKEVEKKGLVRKLPPFFTSYDVSRGTIVCEGKEKEVLIFCSNDYLGMTKEKEVSDEVMRVAQEMGVGSGASRLVTGNFRYHMEFEEFIRDFFSLERKDKDVMLFNSGWCANVGVISALCGEGAEIFSDELNHASIIDGCRLSKAKVSVFRHSDMNHLEELLKSSRARFKMVVVDSLYSMDGDFAPLQDIMYLAERYSACIYVDEAHAFGVFGEKGKGASDMFHVEPHIRLFTLSKSIGCYGAFIIAPRDVVRFLRSRARSFIFSTSLPPSIPAGAKKAIELMIKMEKRRKKVKENAKFLREKLRELGLHFYMRDGETQIIPFIIGDARRTIEVSQLLLKRGFFVQGIRPPSVPRGTSRLRITVTAKHTKEEIEKFAWELKDVITHVSRGT